MTSKNPNITNVKEAAEVLGMTPQFIRQQMKAGKLDIGVAVEPVSPGGIWRYKVYKDRLMALRKEVNTEGEAETNRGFAEDKQLICDLLYGALKATRAGAGLRVLNYSGYKDHETVTAFFNAGEPKIVPVTGDSGVAMILDIVSEIM